MQQNPLRPVPGESQGERVARVQDYLVAGLWLASRDRGARWGWTAEDDRLFAAGFQAWVSGMQRET